MNSGGDRHSVLPGGSDRFADQVTEYGAQVIKLLDKESDRGCVLVASAYMEYAVRRLLFAYCKSVSDVADDSLNKLFKTFDSQFANFASCIRLCRALGLLDDEEQTVLLKFGTWRNQFAHGIREKLIEDSHLKDFMGPIERNVEIAVQVGAVPTFSKFSPARQKFMVWAAVMIAGFHDVVLEQEEAKRPSHSPDAKSQ